MNDRDFDDLTLVAAGSGPDVNGYLFGIDRASSAFPVIEELDHLNSSGIVAVGDRVYRILSSPSEAHASADFIVYDTTGVTVYRRVDRLADPHGLVSDGTNFVVPCSFTNEVRWLSPAGETVRVWRAPGDGDAWHINGLHVRDGRLYASAFGNFLTHRGWAQKLAERTGIVFDVETQMPVIGDLACPHDPIAVEDGWLVCDSFTKRLLLIDEATGKIARQAQLDGWTRGVAVDRDCIYVGVSGARHGTGAKQRARIVVVSRNDLDIIGEIPLPCEEISVLSLIPKRFIAGIRRGFRTNDLRVAVQDRRDLLELAGQSAAAVSLTPMRALERLQDARVHINVRAPSEVGIGEYFDATITIKNRSSKTLFTAAPFPVNIAIVFKAMKAGDEPEIVRRLALPEPLVPGATARFTISVQGPDVAGKYRVLFTLLQEWVRWFNDDNRRLARIRSANRRYISLTMTAPATRLT